MCRKELSFCFLALGLSVVLAESVIKDELPTKSTAGWSHWAGWSPCSKTCGFGQNFRARTCTDPAPRNEAKSCVGESSEVAHCYKGPCLGPEVKGVVFNKESYLNYSSHETPFRYLVLYMHFKPLTADGTLVHRYRGCSSTDNCKHEVLITIEKNRVKLKIKDPGFTASLISLNSIRIGEWQTLLVQVTRRMAFIRLDDKKRQAMKMVVSSSTEMNFDAHMVVGSHRTRNKGFIGTILKLRLNFKDLSLFHSPEWVGFGAPTKQQGTTIEKTNSAESHSRFLGKYSAKIHFKKHHLLLVKLTFYLMDKSGVILFNEGTEPGSYMSVSLHNSALRFCLSLGGKANCQKAILLQQQRWYYLSVLVNSYNGELRIDKGRAIQVKSEGRNYIPKSTLFLGGGEKQDWLIISKLTREDRGFDGVVNEIFINGKIISFKQAVLVDMEGRVNADGYSLSAHVSEVYETPSSKVTMRCDATLFARQGGLVSTDWIESDRFIKSGDGFSIVPKIPGNPFESALVLKPNHHYEGIYACVVNHDGFRVMTHTFPVLRHAQPVTSWLYRSWLVRALLVIGPLLLLTCCVLCVTCCCCRKRNEGATRMTPVAKRPTLPVPPPRALSFEEKANLLNNIESGQSDPHIYTEVETYGSTVGDEDTQEPKESARTEDTKETNDSESDSKDEEIEENEEIIEKASRVLSLIGSIDNLKTVCSRLSQERMHPPMENGAVSAYDENPMEDSYDDRRQSIIRHTEQQAPSPPPRQESWSPSRQGSRYGGVPPPPRLSQDNMYEF